MLPLTLSPTDARVDREKLVRDHREELLNLLREHGAILLRGWGPCDAEHFSRVSTALRLKQTCMSCSAGPRCRIADNVFTANEAPPSERIPFHHEMAQCDAPPQVVLFFCEKPAAEGGATPIVASHQAAAYLRTHFPDVADDLKRRGIRYVRIMPPVTDPTSALGKSWKNVLRVETRDEAERALRALDSTWRWLPGGMLETVTKTMPALHEDALSGHEVFFTAAETTFNGISDELSEGGCGTASTEATAAAKPLRPVKAFVHGDGTPLDARTKRALHATGIYMSDAQVAVPWQAGDVLLINNATVQHAREAFTPPRRILASLVGQLSKQGDLLCEASEVAAPPKAMAALGASPSSTMDQLVVTQLSAFELSPSA